MKNQLNKAEVKEIRKMLCAGLSGRKIADKFGVHHSSIYAIMNGDTWNPDKKLLAKEIQRDSVTGSNNYWAKLNEKKVKQIKKYLERKSHTQLELAIKYGVTSQLISAINTGIIWRHV